MILLLSPAKNLDYKSPNPIYAHTLPLHLNRSEVIIKKMRTFSPDALMQMMNISRELALQNQQRYRLWHSDFNTDNARQAMCTFNGEVYLGLKAKEFSPEEAAFAQLHLRILIGLHGLLRPLDLIMPYRLEMGSKISIGRKKNICEYWKETIADDLHDALKDSTEKTIINLASKEYFAAVDPAQIDARIIHIDFKEEKEGGLRSLQFFLKKARGMMAAFAIHHRITLASELKAFDTEGYQFSQPHSDDNHWTFIRPARSS